MHEDRSLRTRLMFAWRWPFPAYRAACALAACALVACAQGLPNSPVGDVVLVGAGDIASCSSSGDEATAALLDAVPGTVFAAGDNAYDNGTATEYGACYDPSWGRHKARTRPTPGNHDYHTTGAA